jgi:hypothetical protein
MSRITREGFIDSVGAQGGLDLTALGDGAQGILQRAGIGADALQTLAGADHVLRSHDELSALFDLIDRVDHNGHAGSIDTTKTTADGKTLPTLSGEVYEALQNKRETARLGADPASSARRSLAALPSFAVCQRSLTAIADKGFTDVHLVAVPYFNQGQDPWATHPYPKSPPVPGETRTLAQAGCAPTALAMVDCALRGAGTTPNITADFAVRAGASGHPNGAGTDTAGLLRLWAEEHGLGLASGTSHDQSKNVDVLEAGLQAHGVALVSVGVDPSTGRGHFTDSGHVLVINGCAMKDGQEWFSVANPGRADQAHHHRDLLTVDDDVMKVGGAHNGVGQVWISRAQLEVEMRRCFVLRSGGES